MQRRLSIAIALALTTSFAGGIPALSDDGQAVLSWDVTITYQLENGSVVDDQLEGTYSQKITCDGNWTAVGSSLATTSSDEHLHVIKISYGDGVVQQEHQENGSVEMERYTCDDAWSTEPITLDSGWDVYRDTAEYGSSDCDDKRSSLYGAPFLFSPDDFTVYEFYDDGICQEVHIPKTLNTEAAPYTGSVRAWTLTHEDRRPTNVETCDYIYGSPWFCPATCEHCDETDPWDETCRSYNGKDNTCRWTHKAKADSYRGMTLLPPTGQPESHVWMDDNCAC